MSLYYVVDFVNIYYCTSVLQFSDFEIFFFLFFPPGELYFNVLQVVYYGWELLKFIMSKTFFRPKVSSTKV